MSFCFEEYRYQNPLFSPMILPISPRPVCVEGPQIDGHFGGSFAFNAARNTTARLMYVRRVVRR